MIRYHKEQASGDVFFVSVKKLNCKSLAQNRNKKQIVFCNVMNNENDFRRAHVTKLYNFV